jgi:hypothetical protein
VHQITTIGGPHRYRACQELADAGCNQWQPIGVMLGVATGYMVIDFL